MGDAERETGVAEEEESLTSEETQPEIDGEVSETEEEPIEQEDGGDVNEALRQAREENRQLKNMVGFFQNTLRTQQQPPEKKKFDIDPDEPVVGKDLDRFASHVMDESKKSVQTERVNMLESIARDKHADYDEVALNLFGEVCSKNPGLYDAVLASKNPPEMAYMFGQLHPSYQAKLKKKAAVTTAKKIASNATKPTTLAEGGGKKVSEGKKEVDFDNMSREEFLAYSAKVKAKQYK